MSNNMASKEKQNFRVVGLPGDGIGPEVYESACRVLDVLEESHGLAIQLDEQLIGGAAIDATGDPLPAATIDACKNADAALLGAVGGPKWDTNPADKRPEMGLLRIRAEFNLFCNLRPIVTHPSLHSFSPLRPERLENVDLMIVRELTGGSYFGKKWRNDDEAEDVCRYTREEVERSPALPGGLHSSATSASRWSTRPTCWRPPACGGPLQAVSSKRSFPACSMETCMLTPPPCTC